MRDADGAERVAQLFIDNVVRRHGLPRSIVSDRDSRFTSRFWQCLCDRLQIDRLMSTAFHLETDGQTERANRTLIDMLRHYVSPLHDDWDEHLTAAEFAANNAWQESIRMSPFMMNSGQNPLTPATLRIPGVEKPPAMKVTETLQERLASAKHWMEAAQQRQPMLIRDAGLSRLRWDRMFS